MGEQNGVLARSPIVEEISRKVGDTMQILLYPTGQIRTEYSEKSKKLFDENIVIEVEIKSIKKVKVSAELVDIENQDKK